MLGSTIDEVVAELKLCFKTDDVSLTIDEEGRFVVTVDQRFVCITF
jgi:predicted RNase H-like HicB family nuclease